MRTVLLLAITAALAIGGTAVPTAPGGTVPGAGGSGITTFGTGCCKAVV